MNRFKTWLSIHEGDYDAFHNDAGEDFWGNVGAGILPIAKTTGRLLVAYRSKYVNEPHTWGVWGGMVDDEDAMNLEEEAKREFAEETGYNGQIQMHPAYVFKSPGGGFMYHNFIGVLDDEFEPSHNWETEGHKWIEIEGLQTLQPKHFGLETLLKQSDGLIKQVLRDVQGSQGQQGK